MEITSLKLSRSDLSLIEIEAGHKKVLYEIYASTREKEMERLTGWSESQKQAFLTFQFNAQDTYYQKNYPTAKFWVIERNKKIIGRLYLDYGFEGENIRVIDIAILPVMRNKGIGSSLLKDVLELGKRYNKPVTIHVETFNPAKKLYDRLGFVLKSNTNGVYQLMEWRPTIEELN